jgi:hypothetical protein
MAKVYGPLGGTMASGKLGRAFVYGNWRGIAWVRAYRIPHNPRSPLQQAVRLAQKLAVQAWKTLEARVKGGYNVLATVAKSSTGQGGRNGRKMSGYNLFVGLSRRSDLFPVQTYVCGLALSPDGSLTLGVVTATPTVAQSCQVHYSARPWFKWNTATGNYTFDTYGHITVPAPFVDLPTGSSADDIAVVVDIVDPTSGAKSVLASNYTDGKLVHNEACPPPPVAAPARARREPAPTS